jgi:hypothetical protein
MGKIMTLEEYSYVAEIIGVILIITSLVYVARQLHQNTEMLKSHSRQEILGNDSRSIQSSIDERDLHELLSKPEALSFQDQFRFSMIMIMNIRSREHEFFQYRAGVLDDSAWLSYKEIIRVSLDSERRRKGWRSIGREFFDPQFVQMVDEINSDSPLDDTHTRFGTWE